MASLMPSQLRNNVSASHIWRALKPYWVCVAPTVSRVIVTLCPNDSLQQYIVLLNLGHWSLLNVTIGSPRSSVPCHQFMLEQMGSYCIAAYSSLYAAATKPINAPLGRCSRLLALTRGPSKPLADNAQAFHANVHKLQQLRLSQRTLVREKIGNTRLFSESCLEKTKEQTFSFLDPC